MKTEGKTNPNNNVSNIGFKRTFTKSLISLNDQKSLKRQQQSPLVNSDIPDVSLARYLIKEFESLDQNIQNSIIEILELKLKNDPLFCEEALKTQVISFSKKALLYYQEQQQLKLIELLSSVTPIAAILINIEISLLNPNYMEEGSTLSQTLLPYLNQITDYSFMSPKTSFIAQRFLNSLTRHLIDNESIIEIGFIIYALKINPTQISGLINFHNNKDMIVEALVHLKYSREAALIIATYPNKFLWQDLLNFFIGKTEQTITDCVELLSRLDILSDPTNQMKKLIDLFAQRRLLVNQLLKTNKIKIGIAPLIRILEMLLPLKSENVISILQQDSSKWEILSLQYQNKEAISSGQLTKNSIEDLYQQFVKNCESPVSLVDMNHISNRVSEEVQEYRHCDYQSAIAAIIASHNQPFIIVTSPTGSGKTWIQGLVSKYYCEQGQYVTIVEPNEELRFQTADKLGLIDFGITTLTIKQLYQNGTKDPIIILNEYDMIIDEAAYQICQNIINGLWMLKKKKVIAFSATSSVAYERLISNCVSRPITLKFKSEFEIINGISPIQEPNILCCDSQQHLDQRLGKDLLKYYDHKPIILIIDDEQLEQTINVLQSQKFRYIHCQNQEVLYEIRQWDYGILILPSTKGRGIDTRFQKDAIVIVISKVDTYHQLLQMVGRSSRSRNVCESIMYVLGQEKPNQTIERLKRQNMASMQDFEQFLRILEQKRNNEGLIKILMKEFDQGNVVKSLSVLQQKISTQQYKSLVRNVLQ